MSRAMLGRKHGGFPLDADPDSDEAIKAKITEAQDFLAGLEGGTLHIGAPYEGRTEARIYDLKLKIAMYQSILDKRHANRT
jgi:hypothetical protein